MWTWPWRRRRRDPDLPPALARLWREQDDWQEWRPTSPRARTLIVFVAVATAVGVLWAMLQPQLRLQRAQADAASATSAASAASSPPAGMQAPDGRACPAPGAPGCPGGKLDIFVLPATPAEPAPRR